MLALALLLVLPLHSAAPCAAAPASSTLNTVTHFWLQQDLQQAKAMIAQGQMTEALSALLDAANSSLNDPIYSVMNKTLMPPSGNKHDYTSVAIYNWPCNATPPGCKPYPNSTWPKCDNATGLPWRACDGIRDTKVIDEGDSPSAEGMMSVLKTLALAYYFTGNTQYADHACEQLNAWMLDPQLLMDPILAYGQSTPGVTNGSSGGMIEWTGLAELSDVTVLMQQLPCWSNDQAVGAQTWLGNMLYYIWVSGASMMDHERDMANNHGTWYDSTVISLALVSGNTTTANILANNITSHRIDSQILPSGQMPLETARTNGASYCMYNLQAFSHSIALAEWSGLKLWEYESSDGRSVRKALDWMMPYALGKEKWPFPELDPIAWDGLLMPLRYASVALSNSTYEEWACTVCGSVQSYLANTINLTKPPKYNVTSSCAAALAEKADAERRFFY